MPLSHEGGTLNLVEVWYMWAYQEQLIYLLVCSDWTLFMGFERTSNCSSHGQYQAFSLGRVLLKEPNEPTLKKKKIEGDQKIPLRHSYKSLAAN